MKLKFTLVFKISIQCIIIVLFYGCSTYKTRSEFFQNQIQQGQVQEALSTIDKNKFLLKSRNQLLYLLEKGKVAYMANNYSLSNELFNAADTFIEDNKQAIGNKLFGILLNPERETYKGEDFEKVAIHYYKALNYIFLNQYDEALVEAKRISLQLQKINERYPQNKKNRYKDDAFAHNLQGLIYEASGDINNAFIAYRNAINLYLENKGSYFGVSIPKQLSQDLLKTASIMGFVNEKERYEKLLNTKYIPKSKTAEREVVVFWENGLVPYKEETFFTFTILPGNNLGYLTIINKELGLDFPLPINTSSNTKSDFSDLDIFNVAFPKYVKRQAVYKNAIVKIDSISYPLQLAQDYEDIAINTLKDRTLREIGKTALRLGAKKISEYALKNQNQDLGVLLGLFNALNESADTRNWQSLPHQISYARIPLKKGVSTLAVKLNTISNIQSTRQIEVQHRKGIQFQKIVTPQITD